MKTEVKKADVLHDARPLSESKASFKVVPIVIDGSSIDDETSLTPKSQPQSQSQSDHSSSQSDDSTRALAAQPTEDERIPSKNPEDLLRNFDLDFRYGPCAGMTRFERYERALKLDLDPPRWLPRLMCSLEDSLDAKAAAKVHHNIWHDRL